MEEDLVSDPDAIAGSPASLKDRASQLRAALVDTPLGGELFAELMPADIVRVGKGAVLDFSDWSQWDQWGQWQ